MPTLDNLPGELYEVIVQHIEPDDVQQSLLALTRALPTAPIPQRRLFERIRVQTPRQAVSLYQRLRKKGGQPNPTGSWIQDLYIHDWTVDADIILNTLTLLPNLRLLSVWIGPTNCTPEHLEEMFEDPVGNLQYLSLRFRPYVQKANYYQFLKGAYFDSTLAALSRWPPSQIPALSIVQDPIDSSMVFATRQAFAQPLVFFKMDPNLSAMLQSPAMVDSLKSLRLCIPGRPIVRSLCMPSSGRLEGEGSPAQVPAIEILDLSTCGVLEGEVDTILAHFSSLKHLILDECPILRGELREGEWNALGKRCALVGVQRAREREKAVRSSMESIALASQLEHLGLDGAPAHMPAPRARRGRRGLAVATISLRAPSPPRGPNVRLASSARERPAIQKVRLLPPLPSLRTLAATLPPSVKPETYASIRAEFEAGWAEGVAVLTVTRGRLRESARNNVSNVVRFVDGSPLPTATSESDSEGGSRGLGAVVPAMRGLEKVNRNDEGAFSVPPEFLTSFPALCFAGSKGAVDHTPGCGHAIAQAIWRD